MQKSITYIRVLRDYENVYFKMLHFTVLKRSDSKSYTNTYCVLICYEEGRLYKLFLPKLSVVVGKSLLLKTKDKLRARKFHISF